MAILWDPSDDLEPPSDERAIKKFVKAAGELGIRAEIVTRDDYSTLAEYDALFIRQTTNVHHYTYRFARRAAEHDMIVVDDPESILRCTNKVYLAELLEKHGIATPKSLVVHRDNIRQVEQTLGFPCILKQPDSAFSQGVWKVESLSDLERACERLLGKSELLIAQEFSPTEFDWRIGILDRKPLYACKYFMARKHWAIVRTEEGGERKSGRVLTMDVEDAPRAVVRAALKAANLMGDGLYGVDVKEIGKRAVVIEVNDNPSIEAGYEDNYLKEDLYKSIMQVFRDRLDAQIEQGGPE
jgi:glutathione synthase/RimK-type ligase-like ATP-grasp enzyme